MGSGLMPSNFAHTPNALDQTLRLARELVPAGGRVIPVFGSAGLRDVAKRRLMGEGRLVVRITVGADGSVIKVEVMQKLDPQLDAAVIAAVKGWVFKPSMRCGKPMAGGVYTMAKDFELSD